MLIESDTTGSLKDSAELVTASQKWMADQYQAEAERWGYIDPSRWNAFYRWLSDNNLWSSRFLRTPAFPTTIWPDGKGVCGALRRPYFEMV